MVFVPPDDIRTVFEHPDDIRMAKRLSIINLKNFVNNKASFIQSSKYFTLFRSIFPENVSGIPESVKLEINQK
jgi:hypothetical protein